MTVTCWQPEHMSAGGKKDRREEETNGAYTAGMRTSDNSLLYRVY